MNKKKSLNITRSDGDSDGSKEEEVHVIYHIALTTQYAAEKTISDYDPQHALQHGLDDA